MAKQLDTLPRLFEGKTVYVLGGGPSLRSLDGSGLLKDRTTLAINSAVYLGDWVTALFFGDAKWYWWNEERVKAYTGPKFTLDIVVPDRDRTVKNEPDMMLVKKGRTFGHSETPGTVAWNRSSGAAGIDLAVNMGASRIVLLGFDMRRVNDEKSYRKHENDGKTNPNPWEFFLHGIDRLVKGLSDIGFNEVYNATEGSAITCLPRISFSQALSQFPR